ncbi:COG (oligomeric) complex component, COG2 protein, partial [Rhizoctonia solani AG-3 Rhs1AP]
MEDEDGLPYVAPLDASHPLLGASGNAFDVDEFLLSRSHTSLPDLRIELNDYLNKLRTELVYLINENYADFISLSTDLRGEGETIDLMRAPLSAIITEIEAQLRDIQDAVQTKLDTRTALREEQGVLRLLLKLADSVSRVEVLLAISPSNENSAAGNTSPQATTMPTSDGLGLRGMDGLRLHVTEDDSDPKLRAGYAKHLSRAAGELSQVLYLADKARDNDCALVDTLQLRIDRIASTLSRDLDHHLSSTLRALTDSSTMPSAASAERARLTSELVECFKIYDALKMWREAEDVVRRELVRPFIKKTIHPASLTAPQSPILPRTPFTHPPAATLLPHTPFTPFAPLATAAASSFSPHVHPEILIPEPDLGDTTSSNDKNGSTATDEDSGVVGIDPNATENPERIEIIANMVWVELARALMDELGSTVFAVGRPDELRQNYTTTQHLISSLEALAPRASVPALRAHPLTANFSRRWQLPVYFQLRWKDIVGKCEGILGSGVGNKQDFTTPQANAIYTAIKSCWSTQVYIPELGHRFWRLTLQLLSRYRTWMDASLPLKDAPVTQPDRVATLATPGARPSTPDPFERNNVDDASLSTLGYTLSDVRLLQQKVQALWIDIIQVLLPDGIDAGDDEEKAEDALVRSLASIGSYEKTISTRAIAILTKRCAEPLANAKSIPVQYRGARRSVTEPSPFVATVWRPLAVFFGDNGPGGRLKGELGREWCSSIFEEVVARYIALLIKIKQTEQSIRRVNRMPTFSLFGARNTGGEERDDERIRAQMMLDVDSLGNEARALGFGMVEVVDNSEGYKELKRVASQGEAEPTTPA